MARRPRGRVDFARLDAGGQPDLHPSRAVRQHREEVLPTGVQGGVKDQAVVGRTARGEHRVGAETRERRGHGVGFRIGRTAGHRLPSAVHRLVNRQRRRLGRGALDIVLRLRRQ